MAHTNPKNRLQERCQKIGLEIPEYTTTCVGMDDAVNKPLWTSSVRIVQLDREYTLDCPHCGTKKDAEKMVAQQAIDALMKDQDNSILFMNE